MEHENNVLYECYTAVCKIILEHDMIYYNTLSILKSYIKSLMIVIDGVKTSYSIERSIL